MRKCTKGKSCFKHKGWSHQMFKLPKMFKGSVSLNVGLLKHSLFMLSLSQFVLFLHVIQTDWMMMRSGLCVEHWLMSDSL